MSPSTVTREVKFLLVGVHMVGSGIAVHSRGQEGIVAVAVVDSLDHILVLH